MEITEAPAVAMTADTSTGCSVFGCSESAGEQAQVTARSKEAIQSSLRIGARSPTTGCLYIRFCEYSAMGSLEPVDALFQAFADRTRLRILNILREGELCVGDLVQILDVPQPTASRHLGQLRNAGLVKTRRHGLWCFYSLARPDGRLHERLLRCLECCFEEVSELASDLQAARRLRRGGGCCPDAARVTTQSPRRKRTRSSAEARQ